MRFLTSLRLTITAIIMRSFSIKVGEIYIICLRVIFVVCTYICRPAYVRSNWCRRVRSLAYRFHCFRSVRSSISFIYFRLEYACAWTYASMFVCMQLSVKLFVSRCYHSRKPINALVFLKIIAPVRLPLAPSWVSNHFRYDAFKISFLRCIFTILRS